MTQDTTVKLTPVPTQEHEEAAVIQLIRVHNRQTVSTLRLITPSALAPDDGMCSFCQVTARGFAAALADAVRVAREEERERAARLVEKGDPLARTATRAALNVAAKIRARAGEGDATAKPCWTGKRIPFLSHVCCHHVPCCVCPPKGDATPGPELDGLAKAAPCGCTYFCDHVLNGRPSEER